MRSLFSILVCASITLAGAGKGTSAADILPPLRDASDQAQGLTEQEKAVLTAREAEALKWPRVIQRHDAPIGINIEAELREGRDSVYYPNRVEMELIVKTNLCSEVVTEVRGIHFRIIEPLQSIITIDSSKGKTTARFLVALDTNNIARVQVVIRGCGTEYITSCYFVVFEDDWMVYPHGMHVPGDFISPRDGTYGFARRGIVEEMALMESQEEEKKREQPYPKGIQKYVISQLAPPADQQLALQQMQYWEKAPLTEASLQFVIESGKGYYRNLGDSAFTLFDSLPTIAQAALAEADSYFVALSPFRTSNQPHTLEQLRSLETKPFLEKRSGRKVHFQVFVVEGVTYRRYWGEYEFFVDTPNIGLSENFLREQQEWAEELQYQTVEHIIDLRSSTKLAHAREILQIRPDAEHGYYRVNIRRDSAIMLEARDGLQFWELEHWEKWQDIIIDMGINYNPPRFNVPKDWAPTKPNNRTPSASPEILFQETFEGSFPRSKWTVYDQDSRQGLDYWGKTTEAGQIGIYGCFLRWSE